MLDSEESQFAGTQPNFLFYLWSFKRTHKFLVNALFMFKVEDVMK